MKQLFAKKSIHVLLDEMAGDHRLRRVLGPVTLTALGIGAVIGAGIFVATGAAARNVAGPALMVSYMTAGITCIFAALCYAEFASMAPVAGSAYTYAYTTLGELLAWIIGWDLVLEYAVGAGTVANGWSSYFQQVLRKFDIHLPQALSGPPYVYLDGHFVANGDAWINLPAIIITIIVTIILVKGIQESAGFNALMVLIKVAAVLFVIGVGVFFVNVENWKPFAPFGWTGLSFFGFPVHGETTPGGEPLGMLAGAAIIFFAYIGFDSVSTHAEEAVHPQRDVPIGIIASLVICTVLYIAVVAVLTGMVPFNQIDPDAGVAKAFEQRNLGWADFIISLAGVAGITSVLLVMMLSAPRVFLAMSRDGLLPTKFFADVHPRFQTPWKSTILVGLFVSVLSGLLPIDALLHLTNIGTLFAFVIVCAAVLVMRRTHPESATSVSLSVRAARADFGNSFMSDVNVFAACRELGAACAWLLLGLVIYLLYGMRHSKLGKQLRMELAAHGVSPAGTVHPTHPDEPK